MRDFSFLSEESICQMNNLDFCESRRSGNRMLQGKKEQTTQGQGKHEEEEQEEGGRGVPFYS